MQVSSLRISAIPKDYQCNLIYKGFLLDEKKTFEYYEIKKDDIIVVSPSKTFNTKWMKITECEENFKNAVDLMSNKKIMNEVYRLKDLRYKKIELRSSKHFYALKCRSNSMDSITDCFNSFSKSIEKSFPTVIPETIAEKPFDEALTFIWNE